MTPEAFTAIARHAMVPMLLLDGEGRVLAVNDLCCEELDLDASAIIGNYFGELVTAPRAEALEFLRSASCSRELYTAHFCLKVGASECAAYVFEGALVTPAETSQQRRLLIRLQRKRAMHRSFIPLKPKIDELMSRIGCLEHLEQEKFLLLKAEHGARRELEQVNKAKDEFLAAISHELRTPMNVIKGWADLLHQGFLEASEYPEVFAALSRNADLEVQLINELLDVSRIVTGKLILMIQPIDLALLLNKVIESLRMAAKDKQLKITLALEPSLGPVAADAKRLHQVLWNLVQNAIKFSYLGGQIAISVVQNDRQAEIRIADRGIGIDPAFLPYVFERFRQEDGSHKRSHGGLGLGLTLVRHIVEQLQGRVTASSEGKGQGAIFTIILPLMTRSVLEDPVRIAPASIPI